MPTDVSCFSTAIALRHALRAGQISARELLALHLERIAKWDETINVVVVRDFERARADAQRADERLARGERLPLLGLPVTVKESLDLVGYATTAGVPARKDHRATVDAATVTLLRQAGAVIIGKTNVATWLADYQADNAVYGRTNNPWDFSKTSGGSTGGAASVASGFSVHDLGSDLAGSVRAPPNFCGIWGHKPCEGIVPYSGHFPGPAARNTAFCLANQGAIARSAADLGLMLDVITGPDKSAATAWSLRLPPPRHTALKDFRVAVLPDFDWLPVDAEILTARDKLVRTLTAAGAKVAVASPELVGDMRRMYALFRTMMWSLISFRYPAEYRQHLIADHLARQEEFHTADALGLTATASEYIMWHERREEYRQAFARFFTQWDVILTPVTLMPAFDHNTIPSADRPLVINGRQTDFELTTAYAGFASLVGHGATAFPLGFNRAGLPLGLQAIAPFLEDHTSLAFAEAVERELGGFTPPPLVT